MSQCSGLQSRFIFWTSQFQIQAGNMTLLTVIFVVSSVLLDKCWDYILKWITVTFFHVVVKMNFGFSNNIS
jgi:hypothetical protein